MNKVLIQLAMTLGGVLSGTVGGALSYLNTLLKSGFKNALQFHQEGIAFAREMGMSAKEAQAYTEVLTDRTEKLAMKYGVAAEQVKELQRNISVATSRQLMLNESQAEQFLQLNKLAGSSTVNKFTEEMMNGMGGQLDTVTGAVSKAYATAARSGLNAQKVSEKIANNLSLANKLSFRTGIEGLTRMAMQAEKVGMNLSSIQGVADKFLEIDDAIENSARLNMLGGNAAILGGNPLDMAYEANYDPEALMKRVTKMAQGAAKFDAQKGIATVDPMMQDYLRNVAKAIGMNPEELVGSAKKQASNAYKESNISSSYKNMGLSQEQIDFLINKSDVKDGKVMFTTQNGEKVDLSSGQAIDPAVIEEMMKYSGMSDREIMETNAKSLSSISEILTGIRDSITAMFAKFIEGMFPEMQGDLKKFGAWAKGELLPLAKDMGIAVRGAYDWLKAHKEPIKSFFSAVIKFLDFGVKNWKILLATIAGWKVLKGLSNAGIIGRGGAGAAAKASAKSTLNNSTKLARGEYKAGRGMGMTKKAAFSEANKNAVRAAGGYGKLAKAGAKMAKGGGIAAIGGVLGDMAVDEMVENGTIERGSDTHKWSKAGVKALEYGGTGAALGGMIGSVVPVIGNAAGAAVGATIGGIWGAISGWMDASEDGKEAAKEKAQEGAKAAQHWKGGFIKSGSIGIENPVAGSAIGSTTNGASSVVDTAQYGEAILNPTQQKNFMAIANGETPVKPKNSLGEEPEYIYKQTGSQTSSVNGNTITVKDFNINISGTLKLDAGNYSKSIDGRELLNDHAFMTEIKNKIMTSINEGINNGRYLSDLATTAGFSSPTSVYGKR